jgi:hypothetical protein
MVVSASRGAAKFAPFHAENLQAQTVACFFARHAWLHDFVIGQSSAWRGRQPISFIRLYRHFPTYRPQK